MKTSLTSVTFRKKSVEEIVDLVAKAGIDAIEWGGDVHVPPTDPEAALKALKLCQEKGIEISAYGSYYRCGEDEDFAPILNTALILGVKIIRVWAGKLGSAVCPAETREKLNQKLAEAVAMAAEKGLIVATEYHPNTLTDDLDSALQMLADVPGLYTYWQPATSIPREPGYDTYALEKLGKRVVNVHVFHRNSQNQKVPLSDAFDKWVGHFRDLEKFCDVRYGAIEFVMDDTSEQFLDDAKVLREIPQKVAYMVVSEAGASVYSASKAAALEMPEFDLTLRSAVSIARRLQDPLAELVKIDPRSIGVGQYQHDCNQKKLSGALGGVVEDCVNNVGVDLNTASASLLSYISGISSAVAKNIVSYREDNGSFTKRKELLKVSKLGEKAFVQCAGFMRIPDGKEFLDNTSVHPESYDAARALIEKCGYTKDEIKKSSFPDIVGRVTKEIAEEICAKFDIGMFTLRDICDTLAKPGRDMRDELPKPLLRSGCMSLEELTVGMILEGTVRNVIDFGAFVDIGVHQDGLVHISQISNKFIKHPSEVLKVGQIVTVWVISADAVKKRISLTMKQPKTEDNK